MIKLFTVYDSKAARFLQPFSSETTETAIRNFRATVNNKDHQFNLYPEDYTLFEIGAFNDESGHLEPINPHSLGLAITFLPTGEIALQTDAFEEKA